MGYETKTFLRKESEIIFSALGFHGCDKLHDQGLFQLTALRHTLSLRGSEPEPGGRHYSRGYEVTLLTGLLSVLVNWLSTMQELLPRGNTNLSEPGPSTSISIINQGNALKTCL